MRQHSQCNMPKVVQHSQCNLPERSNECKAGETAANPQENPGCVDVAPTAIAPVSRAKLKESAAHRRSRECNATKQSKASKE